MESQEYIAGTAPNWIQIEKLKIYNAAAVLEGLRAREGRAGDETGANAAKRNLYSAQRVSGGATRANLVVSYILFSPYTILDLDICTRATIKNEYRSILVGCTHITAVYARGYEITVGFGGRGRGRDKRS